MQDYFAWAKYKFKKKKVYKMLDNMSYLSERVSYLKGLAKGLKIDETKPEGELMLAIIEVLDDMASEIDATVEAQDEIFDMLEPEEDVDDGCDGDCEGCSGCGDMDYFEVECENCGNIIYLDEDLLANEEEFECPVCKEKITVEIDED